MNKLSRLEVFFSGLIFLFFFGPHLALGTLSGPANVASYIILFFLIVKRWRKVLYVLTLAPLPTLLLLLSIASVFWSAAPDYTATEVRAAIRSTLLGAYLATFFTAKEFMSLLASMIAIGSILSFAVEIAASNQGAWQGIFAQKNILSYIMTIGVLLSIHQLLFSKTRKWKGIFLLSCSLILLFLSQGKGAWLTLIITLSLFPLQIVSNDKYKVRIAFYLSFTLIIASSIFLLFSNLEYIVVDGLGKNLEFNGRIPIWDLMIEKGLEHPLLGYGYSGFWTADVGKDIVSNTWASGLAKNPDYRFNAHNTYMETFLQLGFCGLTLLTSAIVAALLRLVSLLGDRTRSTENLWMLQSFIAMILMGLSEAFGSISATSHWSLFVYISLSSALQKSRLHRSIKFQPLRHFNQSS